MLVNLTEVEHMLITPQEAAEYLSISRSTIYRLLAQGELECVQISGGCKRIDRADLMRFIEERKQLSRLPQLPASKAHF